MTADTIQIVPATYAHTQELQRLAGICYEVSPEVAARWWDLPQLYNRIDRFPEGQWVALDGDGKVVGFSSGLRIHFDPSRPLLDDWEVSTDDGRIGNHVPDGEWMYGVETFVDPVLQGRGIGRKVMEARFEAIKRLNLRGLVAGSLIIGYGAYADRMSPDEYVQQVTAGKLNDPNLSKQLHIGFHVHNLIPNYTTEPRSLNWGVALVWENPDYVPPNSNGRLIRIVPSAPQYVAQMEDLMHFAYGTTREHPDEVFTEAMFLHHLTLFPEGQFIALDGERVVGFTVGARIHYDPAYPHVEPWWATAGDGWLHHAPDGDWMYGVESCVHPDDRGQGIGGGLMDARFNTARALNLRGMVAGSALVGYPQAADRVSIEAYIEGVADGRYFDLNLTKQIKKGFRPTTLIPKYLGDGIDGWGVNIVWDNPDYNPQKPFIAQAIPRSFTIQRHLPMKAE